MTDFPPQGFPRFLEGVSNLGNTVGTTGTINKQMIFAGGNNITLSQSVSGQSATITISGGAAGGVNLAAGTQTATSGTVVFSNSNSITFGMSNSSIVTASFSQSLQAAINAAAGTQTATSGTVVFSNSNNITFGMSNSSIITATAADIHNIIAAGTQTADTTGTVIFSNSNSISFGMSNSSIVTASFSQTVQPDQHNIIAAGTQTADTTGTVIFSNSNNVSFGMSNSSIVTATATVPSLSAGVSTLGNTSGSTGLVSNQIVFVGGNNITLSQSTGGASSATITISGPGAVQAAAVVKVFEPHKGVALQTFAHTQGGLIVQPFWIPFNMTATEAEIIMQISNSSSAAGTVSLRVGIYTYTQSTANSLSTALRTFAYNSTLAGSSYTDISGTRYRSISLESWAFTPGDYLLAAMGSIVTGLTSGTYSWFGRSTLSIGPEEFTGSDILKWGLDGNFSAVTSVLPASFHISDIRRTGSAAELKQPYIVFQGTQ